MSDTDTTLDPRPRALDRALRERANAVIPGGMYGHQSVRQLPAEYPQFMAKGRGARVWDVDGNEYVDLLCSYGPIVLGHRHPHVEEAVRAQARLGDCQNTPSEHIVTLAEEMVKTVSHANWAIFQKNGTDATTFCCTVARATTGKTKILQATGAYHGAAPWCLAGLPGATVEDRANVVPYVYNDVDSVRAAAEQCADDLAGVLVSPFRHDAGIDQELVDPAFARYLRQLCDDTGAALILDDVRCGFRLHLGGSWEPIGVEPDLSAWSKAIANGYALAAVLGNDRFRSGAESTFTTGSFWFAAVSMAASLATLEALKSEDAVHHMQHQGEALRAGITAQADAWGFDVNQTGPPQMPFLSFAADQDFELADRFAAEAVLRGLFIHPRHNWFVSAAMTDDDLALALSATDQAFAALRKHVARA
jgi:glutamate-1-semialdehyde 2,1-aminomutase